MYTYMAPTPGLFPFYWAKIDIRADHYAHILRDRAKRHDVAARTVTRPSGTELHNAFAKAEAQALDTLLKIKCTAYPCCKC